MLLCAVTGLAFADTDAAGPMNTILNVTDGDINDSLVQYPAFVLDCYAEGCNPCDRMGAALDEIAQDFQGEVVFGRIKMPDNNVTKTKYNITGYPTLLFFVNGAELSRSKGFGSKAGVERKIADLFSLPLPESYSTPEPTTPAAKEDIQFSPLITKIEDEDLDPFLADNATSVLICYVDWCGFCQKFAPVLSEVAESLDGQVIFARIDMDDNGLPGERYGVAGFPTLLIFKGGENVDKIVGAKDKDVLGRLLNECLSGAELDLTKEIALPEVDYQTVGEHSDVIINITVDKSHLEGAAKTITVNIFV